MKKIALSLALLYSVQLIPSVAQPPEPTPEPVVTDQEVREAVNAVEASSNSVEFQQVMTQIEALDRAFNMSVSDAERRNIVDALRMLARQGRLNQYNFQAKKEAVILGIVQAKFIRMGLDAGLTRPCAEHISLLPANRLKNEMGVWGTASWIVNKYTGHNARYSFQQEASLSKYDYCRCAR